MDGKLTSRISQFESPAFFNSLHAFENNISPFSLFSQCGHCPSLSKAHVLSVDLRKDTHRLDWRPWPILPQLWVRSLHGRRWCTILLNYAVPVLSKPGFLSDVPIFILWVTETWQRCLEAKKQRNFSPQCGPDPKRPSALIPVPKWHAWATSFSGDRTSLSRWQTSTLEIRMRRGGDPALRDCGA